MTGAGRYTEAGNQFRTILHHPYGGGEHGRRQIGVMIGNHRAGDRRVFIVGQFERQTVDTDAAANDRRQQYRQQGSEAPGNTRRQQAGNHGHGAGMLG